jgi:hypothetical protein
MKKVSRFSWLVMIIMLVIMSSVSSCQPKAAAPPVISEQNVDLGDSLTAIASPIATLYIPPFIARYRIRYIPPGWFFIGSDPEEDKLARGDELPQRYITEPGFWIGESEVTNQEYADCVNAGICTLPSLRETGPTNHYNDPAYDDHPVVGVNWYQAAAYCEWVDARLPTEAEWEKAARGDEGYIYPWGNDAPTCDHANMNSCESENTTKTVASYPLGISPYGLFDMAGNVREWTADWYQEDLYLTAAYYQPQGSSEGPKKVVRGGGFNDFEENLRTTTRMSFLPDQDFDDVGFRCIPVTPSYAPFCEPTYTTLCYDPDEPTPDDPCEPGQGVPGEEGLTFLGYGCPMNRVVNFQVNTNGGGNSGYTATVDGDTFDCQASSAGADVVNCLGPETQMGTGVEIIVCAPGATPPANANVTSVGMAANTVLPVVFSTSGKVSLMAATTANCPDGYTLDEATGACVRDQTQPECPDNWSYNRASQRCEPTDQQEDCPEATTFSANLQGCQPDEEDCPNGYYLTALQTCEPDQNRQDDCPAGYYYNEQIGCCESVPADNYGCAENYYYNVNYQRCVPVDDNNCAYGTTYNGYGQCVQDPDMPGPNDQTEDDCPPGLLVTAANACDNPQEGSSEENPAPGTLLRSGDQLTSSLQINPATEDQGDCPEGYVYSANTGNCIQRDPNNCPLGYSYDQELRRCRPTNGPGSTCPQGYVFNENLNCCIPQPGTDGTRCSDDEVSLQTANDLTGQALTADQDGIRTAGTPAGQLVPFANTHFDILTGLCIDGTSTQDGGQNPCPPGTFSANLATCNQYPEDENQLPSITQDTEEINRQQAGCPSQYWNPNTNTCDYPELECAENEYFDRQVGYCVPIRPDCCEAGQDYSDVYESCVPVFINPRDGECQQGYELLDNLCWLIGRTEGQGQCWTFNINTPRCNGPCEIGLIYNELTGRCDEPQQPEEPQEPQQPTNPCDNVSCGRYNSPNTCPSNCCTWNARLQQCQAK